MLAGAYSDPKKKEKKRALLTHSFTVRLSPGTVLLFLHMKFILFCFITEDITCFLLYFILYFCFIFRYFYSDESLTFMIIFVCFFRFHSKCTVKSIHLKILFDAGQRR